MNRERQSLSRLAMAVLAAADLVCCSRAVLSGRVMDPFGKGIAGASISIEGTSISAMTDADGNYQVRYIPGQFKLHIRKDDNYTSSTVPYNIAESTEVPAAAVVLYPRPSEPGIYFVGKDKLQRLDSAQLRKQKIRNPIQWLPDSVQYLLQTAARPAMLPEGDALFIDNIPKPLELGRALNRSGLVLDTAHSDASGFIRTTTEKAGNEELPVRKVRLRQGVYGWVELGQNLLGEMVPGNTYYGFQVGESAWFECLGAFTDSNISDSYMLLLWKDPSAGVVGEIHDNRLTLSDPYGGPPGLIENAQYDYKTGALSFRANIGWANGAGVRESVRFVGKLSPPSASGESILAGSFERYDATGRLEAKDERKLIRRPPDFCSIDHDSYSDLASWRANARNMLHGNEHPLED